MDSTPAHRLPDSSHPTGESDEPRQLDIAVPMLYAIVILATVFFFDNAIVPVAVVGAMLIGLYYSVRARGSSGGRNRNRNWDRDTGR